MNVFGGPVPIIGRLSSGPRNSLTDVAGVAVGHSTLAAGPIQTGVTVVRVHASDPFRQKVPAGTCVINGFGKSLGLVQVEELGLLDTPIALTNTFSVGTTANAQIRQAIAANPEIGRAWPSVNPLVFECNDGYLNDMQAMRVDEADYLAAHDDARADFAQGSIGAGRGMSSFDLKGGIGSASRLASIDGRGYTVGALVLANFGRIETLSVGGAPVGVALKARLADYVARRHGNANDASMRDNADNPDAPEKGSIIMVIGTDAPLDAWSLRRVARRAAAGLARTGSVYGHGSGDIALAFTTAYTVSHDVGIAPRLPALIHPAAVDPLFHAAAEAVEQAIVHALWAAQSVTGRDAHHRCALTELAPDWASLFPPFSRLSAS